MRELDAASVTSIRDRISADHNALQQQPEDLEQLKGVLHVINSIRWGVLGLPASYQYPSNRTGQDRAVAVAFCRHSFHNLLPDLEILGASGTSIDSATSACGCRSGGMQMELQCSDLQERYRTRVLYAITDSEKETASADVADAAKLSQEWCDLCEAAEAVDLRLEGVKQTFTQTTRQQVSIAAWAAALLSCSTESLDLALLASQCIPLGLYLHTAAPIVMNGRTMLRCSHGLHQCCLPAPLAEACW